MSQDAIGRHDSTWSRFSCKNCHLHVQSVRSALSAMLTVTSIICGTHELGVTAKSNPYMISWDAITLAKLYTVSCCKRRTGWLEMPCGRINCAQVTFRLKPQMSNLSLIFNIWPLYGTCYCVQLYRMQSNFQERFGLQRYPGTVEDYVELSCDCLFTILRSLVVEIKSMFIANSSPKEGEEMEFSAWKTFNYSSIINWVEKN
jgi:hypothetical protein